MNTNPLPTQKVSFKSNQKFEGKIDRENGIIQGFSVIQKGEALGHGMYVDDVFLDSLVSYTQKGKGSFKARFTHPGMCSDGLAKRLGNVTNYRKEGDKVLGDLKFSKSAYNTPEGDLASYTMDMGEEDPDTFGASIVFSIDRKAEEEFRQKHSVYDEELGRNVFKSPDKNNTKNLPHVRLSALHAVDIVDDPAANRDGLFSADSILYHAEGVLDAIFKDGVDSEVMGYHTDRIKSFCKDYFMRNGITINFSEEKEMTEEVKTPQVKEVAKAVEPVAPAKTYDQGIEEATKRASAIYAKANELGLSSKAEELVKNASYSAQDAIGILKDIKLAEYSKASHSQNIEPEKEEVKKEKTPEEEFASDSKLQASFSSVDTYKAYLKAVKNNNVSIK